MWYFFKKISPFIPKKPHETLFFLNIAHSPYIASHANVLRGSSRVGQERVTNPQERMRGLRGGQQEQQQQQQFIRLALTETQKIIVYA